MYLNVDLSIKAKGIANRINSEFNNLFNQSELVSTYRIRDAISIKIVKDNNVYELILQHDYPFKCPESIYYNGVDYKKHLFSASQRIRKILKQKYNISCLCCDTVISGKNWTPAMNICYIINEIIKMTKIKKEIKFIILCDEIRDKYNCCFAEFEKYLF